MRFKPKKSLGQNFLIDKNIQRKIISACAFKSSDIILEIGAGRGEITRLIAPLVKKLYALEIDRVLAEELREALKDYRNVKIINADILKFDFKKIEASTYKVVGNIPYYITTPVIGKLLMHKERIEEVYLSIQKEVARRIIARPGSKEFGAFSCFVQYYAEPRIIFPIKRGSFWPQPKVDSVFLRLSIRPKPPVKVKDEKLLFKIIRLAFNQRRKVLKNSLRGIVSEAKLSYFFAIYNINPHIRPEDLCLEDFANLAGIAPTINKPSLDKP